MKAAAMPTQPARAFAPLLLALLPACFASRTMVNEPLRAASLGALVPGTSTAKDVVELLGAPSEVIQLGSRTAYRYDYSVQKRAGFTLIVVTVLNEDTRSDRAWFFFDKDDKLTHAGSTLESDRARYAMPWAEVHGK